MMDDQRVEDSTDREVEDHMTHDPEMAGDETAHDPEMAGDDMTHDPDVSGDDMTHDPEMAGDGDERPDDPMGVGDAAPAGTVVADHEVPGGDPAPDAPGTEWSGVDAGDPATGTGESRPALVDGADDWTDRWNDILIGFVDEPRRSIEHADALVGEVVTQVTARLTDEHESLGRGWSAGTDPSTEDLRVGLKRYRELFERLRAV
jgi:hypothetical protein